MTDNNRKETNMTIKTAVEILQGAASTISKPDKWARGWYALNEDGDHVDPADEDAICWCILGAMLKVADLPTATVGAKLVWHDPQSLEFKKARDALKDVLMGDRGLDWVRNEFTRLERGCLGNEVPVISFANDHAHKMGENCLIINACTLAVHDIEQQETT